jgi:two-component system sensor histidine kinase HydH
MQTGVAAVDASGTVRLANHAFLEIFGLSDPIGMAWSGVVQDYRLGLKEFVRSDVNADEDELSITIGDAEKTVLIVRSKLSGEGSVGPSVVMVANDITRLKEYEAITARREWLSELGNLAAGVAHEIRNPLNTISIAAQRLAAEFEPAGNAEEYRSFTENIRTETKRLNEIITRFLSLSRAEQKKQTKVRLDEVVAEATDLLKVEAAGLNIELDVSVERGLLVIADPDKLKQIIQNLFNNAKEAMDGRAGKIVVEAGRSGDQVTMTFGDNGPGIPRELRTKVFTPYFTTKESGTGLGLATVHQMMTEIGGDVSVGESELGGVKVVLVFPPADSIA